MNDPWVEMRETLGEEIEGGSEHMDDSLLCPGCVYDLLTDADALLAVVRTRREYDRALPTTRERLRALGKYRKALATLPEHLKGV